MANHLWTYTINNDTPNNFNGYLEAFDVEAVAITTLREFNLQPHSKDKFTIIFTDEEWPNFSNGFARLYSHVQPGYVVVGNSFVKSADVDPIVIVEINIYDGSNNGEFPLRDGENVPVSTPDRDKTLWVTNTTGTSGVTVDDFREGTDKIVSAVFQASVKGAEGGGSGGGMTSAEFDTKYTEAMAKKAGAAYTYSPTQINNDSGVIIYTEPTALKDAAVSQALALFPGSAPTGLGYSPDVSGDADWLKVELPESFGGKFGAASTVDFNPFRSDRMGPLATWFRFATEWAILALLGYSIFTETRGFIFNATQARQATGNPIAGGTGAQGTALIAAGFITAAFVVLMTAILSYSFGGIDYGTLITNLSVNPLNGAPVHIMWFLDQLLPITTMITAFVARISFPYYGMALYTTFAITVRWVVP